jgi:hypothetical protein
MIMRTLILVAALAGAAHAQTVPPDPGRPNGASFLEDFAVVARYAKANKLVVACETRPCTMRGDFDGDGRKDLAVQVQDTAKQRAGLVVIMGGRQHILGAGAINSPLGDDWSATPRIRLQVKTAMDAPPIGAKGDLIAVSPRAGSAESMIYFDGSKFRVSQ